MFTYLAEKIQKHISEEREEGGERGLYMSELLLIAKMKLQKIIKVLSIVSLSWRIKNKVWGKKKPSVHSEDCHK